MTVMPPVSREVLVPADAATAYRVFLDRIGQWWPIERLSVFHDGTVAFLDHQLVELAADGREAVWGTVTESDPPCRLSFTWHPGGDEDRASHVTVTFGETADGTLVRLVHEGWESFSDPIAARADYDKGWPGVLTAFGEATGDDADTWVVATHRARRSPVFSDPLFTQHTEFLGRMKRFGMLVAAGPLDPSGGEGMTILRLPGAAREELAWRFAEADASVRDGLLAVEVRPWSVMASAR